MKGLALLLISILMAACSAGQTAIIDPEVHFRKVPVEVVSVYSRIYLEKYDVLKPWDVLKKGNVYFVYDYGSRQNTLCKIDLEKGEVRKGVGKGSGPGELQMIERLLLDGNDVTVFDGVKNERYKIVEGETDDSLKVVEYRHIDVELVSYPTFRGEMMATKNHTGDAWIYLYNKGAEIGRGDFPHFSETDRLTMQERVSVFRNGQQKFSPDGTKLATCISNGCAIAMYDCSDSSLNERAMLAYYPPVFSLTDYDYQKTALSLDSRAGFLDVACTDKYVYALYSGRVLSDDLFTAYYGNHIFVYDWDGNPVKHYVLDKDLFMLNIDEDNGTLYGVSNDPEGCILEYKL